MVARIIEGTEMRVGTYILLEKEPYQVKKIDISKTGKHGHAKVRFEAVSLISGKKKVSVVPGHDKFEVPMITKHNAQVLSISDNHANIMDTESFESFDIEIPDEFKDSLQEGSNIEYWNVEGQNIIRKVL